MMVSTNVFGAPKSFDGITCKSDVRRMMIGRQMVKETVKNTESRYRGILLEDLGAFGVEAEGDPWMLIGWLICNREYLILERHGVVKDVLPAPKEGADLRSRIVSCTVEGSRIQDAAVIFEPSKNDKWPRSADDAWLINDREITF